MRDDIPRPLVSELLGHQGIGEPTEIQLKRTKPLRPRIK